MEKKNSLFVNLHKRVKPGLKFGYLLCDSNSPSAFKVGETFYVNINKLKFKVEYNLNPAPIPKDLTESGFVLKPIGPKEKEFLCTVETLRKRHKVKVNYKAVYRILNAHSKNYLSHYKLNAILTTGDNILKYCLTYGMVEGPIKHKKKSERVAGSNNPAYQHGGRLSPYSKKFKKYEDGSASYSIDDVIAKQQQTFQENPQNRNTTIEYYTHNYNVDEETAKQMLSERQSTFSLRKLIDKYGEEVGTKLWSDRQEKWQETLNSKPQEEIDEINSRKVSINSGYGFSTIRNNKELMDQECNLYYIKIEFDDVAYYKIGITKDFESRFNIPILFSKGIKITPLKMTQGKRFDCFITEQHILKTYSKFRVKCQHPDESFSTHETFNIDVLKDKDLSDYMENINTFITECRVKTDSSESITFKFLEVLNEVI